MAAQAFSKHRLFTLMENGQGHTPPMGRGGFQDSKDLVRKVHEGFESVVLLELNRATAKLGRIKLSGPIAVVLCVQILTGAC